MVVGVVSALVVKDVVDAVVDSVVLSLVLSVDLLSVVVKVEDVAATEVVEGVVMR